VTTNTNVHCLEDKKNLTMSVPVNVLHDTNSNGLTSIKNL